MTANERPTADPMPTPDRAVGELSDVDLIDRLMLVFDEYRAANDSFAMSRASLAVEDISLEIADRLSAAATERPADDAVTISALAARLIQDALQRHGLRNGELDAALATEQSHASE